ncbi:MAG: radical SAM protein [Magnetococcales bacterium]|nr:radical SAM protein [Magnetococcales bacterium]NGZ06016.1 radical SAM protein [Magnetococcales bacterium]
MNPLRTLHLAHAILRANLGLLRNPYKLTFVVTWRCNARCRHCEIWNKNDPTPPLSLNEIERFIQQYPGFTWIDLTGGEPFLRPDIVDLTALLLRHSPRLDHLHLPTNAVSPALTIQRIEELLRLDPPMLTITLSLDGPLPLHDRLRGVEGNGQNVLEVLRHFHRHPDPRLRLYLGFTLSDHNVGTLTATKEAVQREMPWIDWHHWHLNLAHTSAHYYGNSAQPLLTPPHHPALIQEITTMRAQKASRWWDPVSWLETRYLDGAIRHLAGQRQPLPCLAIHSSLYLAPDGTCYPCSIWNHPVGQLRDFDYDLSALLASTPARHTREMIHKQQCPGCWTPCDAYPTILGHLVQQR